MTDDADEIEPVFTEENRKLFFFASAILILVWILINFVFKFLDNIISPDSDYERYYLLLSLTSLIVSYLIGYMIYYRLSIDKRVQHKYDTIMKSLVVDGEGNKVFQGNTKKAFTKGEWIKLGIEKHLNLIEVSQISDRIKLKELEVILDGVNIESNSLQYAEVISWISTKLNLLGEFESSKNYCNLGLNNLPEGSDHAEGIIRSSLGVTMKKLGESKDSSVQLEKAIELIPSDDKIRILTAKKDLLRLNLLTGNTETFQEELDEIHEMLKQLARSNDGSIGGIDSWRINSALESFYDLHSTYLSSVGEIQWATRYSFAATVLAESRTGYAESTFSMSHLTKHLMNSNDFTSAKNLLDDKKVFLEERGNSRGWVSYNIARCHYGLQEFDQAIEQYLEAVSSNLSSADIVLASYIGLHYANAKIGNSEESEKYRQEAEKLAESTGFKPVWVEPKILEEGITQTEADVNQFDWQISGKKVSWIEAISFARERLGIKGFEPIKKGTEFYDVAKAYYDSQNSK